MGRYTTHTAWLPDTSTSQSLILGLTSTVINTQTLNNFITKREGIIDSYLGLRWTPSDYATAPTVKMLTEQLITYGDLYPLVYTGDSGLNKNDQIVREYETAMEILTSLRDGKGALYDSAGTRISERGLSRKYNISSRNYTQTFNEDHPLNWRTSRTKLHDISDARLSDD